MAKKSLLYIVVAAIMVSVVGCSDEFKDALRDLFGLNKSLEHGIDNQDVKVFDYMKANIKITENENVTNLPSSPAMEASIQLSKSDIRLDKNQLVEKQSVKADSVKYDGKKWNSLSATDNTVLKWYMPGGQVVTVPVNITALRTQYKGKYYNYGTDSLIDARLSVSYVPAGTTRASESNDNYNAVYEAELTFKEVNHKDSVFTVTLKTSAAAKIDDSNTSYAENGHWVWTSDSTYRWDFDYVTITDGIKTVKPMSIPANYRIKGIDPYEKIVKTFNYAFNASNGWNKGEGERQVASSMEYVTIYEKSEDHYGATILNLDDNDKIVTDYTAVLQRVVFDDGIVHSEATYPEVTANEANTFVKILAESSKDDYNAALLTNSVDFTILEHVQNISEEVYLYVRKNTLLNREIVDAVLKVYDDYEEASLTYREIYTNGDVKEYKEKRNFARTRKTLSDWLSSEQYFTAITDAAKVELIATSSKEDGYWSWVQETRDITTQTHLYASTQTNKWREVVANSIKYTRDGITYEFKKLEYVATESGQKLDMVSADEYNFTDSITIQYDDNKVGMTAPGKIKITGKQIKGHENRNKNIEVTSDSVIAKVDHVTMFMDGSEEVDKVRHSFPRVRTTGPAWSSYEENGNETTSDVSVDLTANELVVEGEWSCTMQTRGLSTTAKLSTSTRKNTWTSKDPNNIKFTRNGITCDFGTIAFSAVKNASASTLKSSSATEDTYAYSVGVNETYGDCVDILGGEGTIIVKKGKTIIGHQVRNQKLTISDNKVEASLTFVDIWSDGSETSVDDYITAERSLEPTSNINAYSDYANVLTGEAVVVLNSSNAVESGYWKYNNQTRTITTQVTLSNSTETNSWTSVDPNNFVYERDDLTYTFDEIKYTAVEYNSALGNLISETDTQSTYSYKGGIKVTFGDNTKTSTAPGKVTVKKVITYSIKNAKLTVNDDNALAELDFITTTDGVDKTEHFAQSFPISLICSTFWSSNENTVFLSVNTSKASITAYTTEAVSLGDWTYVRENRTITTTATLATSSQTNSWTSIVPNNIVFSKNGVSHDFGTISFAANEGGQNYVMSEQKENIAVYDYTDKLNVTFGGHTASSVAPGKITVEYSISGNEIRDQKLEVTETGVNTSLTWVTKYSNGYEKTEAISHFFALKIEELTNWTSTEANSNSSTGAATVNLESSNNEVDGYWSCTREERKVNTIATLAGSTQNNTLHASMPNSITFSRDGKTYNFAALNFVANEAGQNVSKTSEDDFETVYGYTDKININFGGRDFSNTLNGTINVEKPWVPDIPDYGKFKFAVCTATPNENRSSWVYVVSAHFERGTLPIKIERNATSVDLDFSLFTTNTDDAINSLVYTGGQWINSIASDERNCMLWKDENGTKKRVLDYVTATALGWNDGNNTIISSAVTTSVSRNILYITKNGSTIGKIKLHK